MSKELMSMPPLPAGSVLEANNIYLFMEEFTASTVKPVIEFILSKNLLPAKQRPPHLTLIINSPGGEVASAFALIDTMKGSAIPVHTVGLGEISSCGILTFMNGAKGYRTLTPNTMILSHQFSGWAGGKEHELAARTTHFKQVSDRIMHSYKVATGLSDDKIKKFLLPPQDVWLTAKEAVKYGLADKIKIL